MSVSAAPIRDRRRVALAKSVARPRHRHPLLAVACLALAAVSLLLRAPLAYDPWAWLTWGRQLAELDLNTRGGPAWKPLPAFADALLSLTGSAAPTLWLWIARAGAFFAVAIAARLAFRLAPGGTFARASAGIVAALGVLSCTAFLPYLTAKGMSEPLLVAALLYALDRHLAGHPGAALASGLVAALVRPESWPLLALYAAWLALRRRVSPRLLAAGAGLIIAAWLLPDLLGSGNALRSFQRASVPDPGSPGLSADPALEVLRQAWLTPPGPIRALFALGAGVALVAPAAQGLRSVRRWALAGALGWCGVVAAMAQLGTSAGDARYVLPGVALGCVLAGVGWGQLASGVELVAGRAGGQRGRLAAQALAASVAVGVATLVLAPPLGEAGSFLETLRTQAATQADLRRAVDRAGGPRQVTRCGRPVAAPLEVSALAWVLHVPLAEIRVSHASVGNAWYRLAPEPPGVVFRRRGGWLPPLSETAFARVAVTRYWTVRATCSVPSVHRRLSGRLAS